MLDRSQLYSSEADQWVKRHSDAGGFTDQKADEKLFRGVWKDFSLDREFRLGIIKVPGNEIRLHAV